ncbi:hypothetical protein UA08_02850 [Talaromyces atroroseus]|uniref:DUF1640 domain-containing protein n=1 Tax=Talaromyces atroroseus TaxID=1441469 RepID=A0A225B8P4_TALAT|nr:hypothetical protein UA08_02850 [Talaromyces atroroseus]OKL62307.1 hypothetical protein UA08_02850 [Talaromyces atroroseus]
MAPSKQITVTPRYLLPRLTWNGTPRITITAVQGAPVSTVRPHNQYNRADEYHIGSRKFHVSADIVRNTSSSSSSSSSSSARFSPSPSPSRPSTSPGNSTPIRHNGVYVAAFKPARRAFHASAVMRREHHFDTLKFVQRLKAEGFSEDQAVAMMKVLNDVIQESIQNLTRTMVLKEDTERATYTQKVDFAKLRSELLNSDSTEAQLTRSSHERIAADLAKMNSRLRDEIGRTQASVRLDLNLEKGRIREEANSQEMRIKETETRIEQEVAGLRERVQAVQQSTLQWLVGVCTGTAALIVGAWRLLIIMIYAFKNQQYLICSAAYAHSANNISLLGVLHVRQNQTENLHEYANYTYRLRDEYHKAVYGYLLDNPPKTGIVGIAHSHVLAMSTLWTNMVGNSNSGGIKWLDANLSTLFRLIYHYLYPSSPVNSASNVGQEESTLEFSFRQSNHINKLTSAFEAIKSIAWEKHQINITSANIIAPDFFNDSMRFILSQAAGKADIHVLGTSSPREMIDASLDFLVDNATRDMVQRTDKNVLIIDHEFLYVDIQPAGKMCGPLIPLYNQGAHYITYALMNKTIAEDEDIRQQINQGASEVTLYNAIYEARLLIRDKCNHEDDYCDEWELDLDGWWAGEEKRAVLRREDVQAVDEAEDIDAVVILESHGDARLIKRAVELAIGEHVELVGGGPGNSTLVTEAAARAAFLARERIKDGCLGQRSGHDEL